MESYIGKNGTFALMKNLNLEKVFRTVVLRAPISRAEISRVTGLNKVTVSNCVKTLMDCDLISEEGIVSSDSGRPPVMLMLSKTFGVLIGVEISAVSTNIVVTDLRGTILEKPVMEHCHQDPETFFKGMEQLIAECSEKYNNMTHGVIGLGVALPVNYNQKDESYQENPPLPEWKGVDAYKELKKRLGKLPVAVLTTAAAGAMGEVHFGDASPDTYLAYLHGAWGLKLDLYSGGGTYSMSSDFSGRVGQMIVERNGKENEFGSRGCLESYASIHALINKLYPNQTNRYESVLDLMRRQKFEDPEVEEAMQEVYDYLAIGLTNLIHIFHPETLCIGSYLGLLLGRRGLDQVAKKVEELTHGGYPVDQIICSKLGIYGVSFGCISWIRDHLIEYLFDEEEGILC